MEEKLERNEAMVLLQFITDSGMDYLYEYAVDYDVDIEALIDKLRRLSV